ncbi:MAG: hypothetical protein F7C08_00205 [Desulfurococcales archaeon]|nr:hypothetical protein [Desulfurococcales archaeon]MCE4604950.1 hypothetical protein [Desulfurococcales archaeon]
MDTIKAAIVSLRSSLSLPPNHGTIITPRRQPEYKGIPVEAEKARARVLEALRECGPCSFEDLIERVGGVDLWLLRRVIADMVRRGEVVKVPSQERRKLLYSLPPGDVS